MSFSAIKAFLGCVTSVSEPEGERPAHVQAAALCLRDRKAGREVLLVTSLTTKRWIVPKGWPMKGKTLAEAALTEAWEEAGVRGRVLPDPVAAFTYLKEFKNGETAPCRCELFLVDVREQRDDWPEAKRRTRRWVPLAEAATMVAEDDLRALFTRMAAGVEAPST